jgi:hypothetical protein
MKLLFQIATLTTMLFLSACSVYSQKSPESTSSGRAAYGSAASDFNGHVKINEKRKKKARKQAKRTKSGNAPSPWYRRPY